MLNNDGKSFQSETLQMVSTHPVAWCGAWAPRKGQPSALDFMGVCVWKRGQSVSKYRLEMGFPGGSVVKNLPANAGDIGDAGLIPGSERSPGRGNGNPLQYSCLENSMDRGAW